MTKDEARNEVTEAIDKVLRLGWVLGPSRLGRSALKGVRAAVAASEDFAALVASSAPPPEYGDDTEVFAGKVEQVRVSPGENHWLILVTPESNNANMPAVPIILYWAADRPAVFVNDNPTDERALATWLMHTPCTVRLTRDVKRYGLVVKAEFYSR